MPATLLRLQEKPQLFVVTNVVRLIITLLLTLYFLTFLKMGLKSIFIAQVIGNFVYTATFVKYCSKNFTVYFDFKVLKDMLRYGLPLIYSSLSSISITMADKYILGLSSSLANSGVYSFGFKIANTVYYFVIESANLALGPIVFSLMNSENNTRFYSKIMTYMSLFVLIIIMGISLFSKEIILFLARRPEYYDAYKIIPIITFSAVFMMMRDNAMRVLNIVKKTKIISIIVVIISVFNFVLNVALIPSFGIYGASLTFFLTQFLNFILIFYFAQKYYYIPYEKGKISLMIGLSVVILLIAFLLFSDVSWMNIALKLLLIGIFPIILYFFNFYEQVEIQKIKEIIIGSKKE
jgi:O-antigen/teichoic acid export membrane protein